MFPVTKALKEALLQHFLGLKLEIAYAIHKPFPFFESLRDKSLITERMYMESLEAYQNLVPVSRVVHNILTQMEPTFDLSLLMALFSPINLREYPTLMKILRSFERVGAAYEGWGRATPVLTEVPADPAEGTSKIRHPHQDHQRRLLPLPPPPSSLPGTQRVSQPEACTQPSRRPSPAGPAVALPGIIQEEKNIPVASANLASKTHDGEDSQALPRLPPGPVQVSERPEGTAVGIHSLKLPVTCGEAEGVLHKERMKRGPSEKCIQDEKGAWFTPREFEVAGKRAKSKNWKRSVLCRGQSLGQLLEKGLLLCPSQDPARKQLESESAEGGSSAGGASMVEPAHQDRRSAGEGTQGGDRGCGPDPGQDHDRRSPPRASIDLGDQKSSSGRVNSKGCQGVPQREPVPFPESRKGLDCPALPPGWKREEVIRKSGLSAGRSDVYYYSPSGVKFRSKVQLTRALGSMVDLSSFDYRTGTMLPPE
ncbi:interferon-induced protein 75-like [Tenrec ecaudatus]|uniref:interferon-induced protein 75-like n=1 Tax=Tenrec ecaudatus TaxID=94439 RepID=UPI003F5AB03E